MKTVQIPYDLFIDLAMYHLRGEDDYEEEIHQGLEQKLDAMLNRQLYSRYKTAPTKEEREQARQEYLDRRGVPQSLRWMWAEDYAQRTPANKLLTTPVFAVFVSTLQAAKPAEASAEAAYPLGEPTILCSRRMKVS